MSHFVAIAQPGRLRTWRRVGGRLVPWRDLTGSETELALALKVTRELSELAAARGGWEEILRDDLDFVKPVEPLKTRPRGASRHLGNRPLRVV